MRPRDTITVVNEDATAHTLTASDKFLDTSTIASGKSETLTTPNESGQLPLHLHQLPVHARHTLTVS
ncbi:hypothetical protein ACFC1R_30560 [Kitasatospora sp. NPDC056138]|uniref:hypothetical protein n=1 Tax=Kitasatospora sp. NPDC056138 TaxID=3345724 RepID=UPI0035D5E5E4